MIEEKYRKHLEEKLQSYTSDYKVKVCWYMQLNNTNFNLNDDNILIVISKLSGSNYKSVSSISVMISALCSSNAVATTFSILDLYQKEMYNNKYFIDGILISESYYAPSLDQNFLELNTNYGTEITMQGSISISENASDIKRIKLNGNEVEFLMVTETLSNTPVSATLTEESGNYTKLNKALNQAGAYQLDLKIVNDQIIGAFIREMMHGQRSINSEVKVALTYTDNDVEIEKSMIVINAVKSTANDVIPTISISLIERLEVEENG